MSVYRETFDAGSPGYRTDCRLRRTDFAVERYDGLDDTTPGVGLLFGSLLQLISPRH
ncbi:hypothetical protein BH11GEM2_BH11GEM2_31480 [soil metagenome]